MNPSDIEYKTGTSCYVNCILDRISNGARSIFAIMTQDKPSNRETKMYRAIEQNFMRPFGR